MHNGVEQKRPCHPVKLVRVVKVVCPTEHLRWK